MVRDPCVSASARQSRAQCRAREFCCKILFGPVPSDAREFRCKILFVGGVGMSGWRVGGRRGGSGVTAPVVRATASEEAVARASPVA